MSKREKDSTRKRSTEKRQAHPVVLIVSEGSKTEPNYFRKFPVKNLTVKIRGIGQNTKSVVAEAIRLNKEQDYTAVWCVFDRDSFPAKNFNDALEMAKKHHISVAWSNECFELWYILHFKYVDSSLSRSTYEKQLSDVLGEDYDKASLFMYEKLKENQEFAIKMADMLYNSYSPHHPVDDNPCTTVQDLVRFLNQHSP
jgi:RloB-like protein